MTNSELLQLARECDGYHSDVTDEVFFSDPKALESFAAKVRERALDEAAALCDQMHENSLSDFATYDFAADSIRNLKEQK